MDATVLIALVTTLTYLCGWAAETSLLWHLRLEPVMFPATFQETLTFGFLAIQEIFFDYMLFVIAILIGGILYLLLRHKSWIAKPRRAILDWRNAGGGSTLVRPFMSHLVMIVGLLLASFTLPSLSWKHGKSAASTQDAGASTFPGYVVYERAVDSTVVKVPGRVFRANSQFVAIFDTAGVTVIPTGRFRGMIIP